MAREEAVKLLQATRLMLMDGANQPISDLYYALDMAIEALEQTEPSKDIAEAKECVKGGGCKHYKYIAHEWQCETEKCQGYEPT